MLVDYVAGSELDAQWGSMSWLEKELLVRRIVLGLVQLFGKRFSRMGSLYKTADLQRLGPTYAAEAIVLDCGHDCFSLDNEFCLGSVIQMPFFWGNNLKLDVDRGPFSSSQDWLRTVLRLHSLAVDDPVAVMSDSDNDSDSDNSDDKPDPENTPAAIKHRVQRLMDLLPATFPADGPEAFVLHHHDLHAKNIFMGDDHELSGIIDWECISTVPLWAACEFPKFLQTELNRHVCPDPDKYMKEVLDDGTEELNVMYYEHLVEYEKTRLRVFFLEQMQRECPEWVEVYQNSKLKATFEEVVAALNDKSNASIIDEWLDTMEEHGAAPGIGDMLHEYEQELLDYELASSKGRKTKDAEVTKE
ncbi:hypothetical protein C7974DRAFT_403557 [Boeremia exigua]|uniref:uncharacterized protein n=1 Tax=Boeremia exigua TaxID=749465 RepID=UPI001E8D8058|nr:uncharacterized protein C7974DRAFT_403557 [Boeremia exigua]KAH6615248.1 hypothetical protein C7974DRAFT_403557 [Boeremia exigua]